MTETPIKDRCFICGFVPSRLLEGGGENVCRKCAQRAIDEMVAEKKVVML